MKTRIIEATQNIEHGPNWAKVLVAEFDEEWEAKSALDMSPLLLGRGWEPGFRLVLDLQTGEGAIFRMGGLASSDLNKHRIHVCPLFEGVLTWLYDHPMPLGDLPNIIVLPNEPGDLYGYRRPGESRE